MGCRGLELGKLKSALMRQEATPALIQEAIHSWLCRTPLPNHIRLFDIIDVYETGGMWGFTHQGEKYRLRPPQRAPEITVSLPQSEWLGRGKCIVCALGKFDMTKRPMCNITRTSTCADICVAAYFPDAGRKFSFVLIAYDSVE